MDISDIVASSREMELKHPDTDLPLGIHIELLPMSDKRVKVVERRIRDQILKQQSKGKAPKSADLEENEIELIAAAMIGWRWEADKERGIEQPTFDGEEHPEFKPANVKKLLRRQWAKDQIDEELGNTGDFFAT